ncbi:MAG: hypothetical protein QOC62_4966 [Mycobacterium sp.]|nr:hypothetical protein [Mycobacterium sp.]
MDEFTSAEQALVVIHHLQRIGHDDQHRRTPCTDCAVQALAEHLVDTISPLGGEPRDTDAEKTCRSLRRALECRHTVRIR